MRTVDGAPSGPPTPPACPRCAERAALLGVEINEAQRDSETSRSRRGEWHVLLRGLQRGPYPLATLRQLLAESHEADTALVWRAGMLDWMPAHQLELPRDEARPSQAGAAIVQAVESAKPPNFHEASLSLRPAGRSASRAAGETTLEFPAYRALSARAVWLRWLALGSLVSIAAVGAYVTTLRQHGARRAPKPPPVLAQRESVGPPALPPPPPPRLAHVASPAATVGAVGAPDSTPLPPAAPQVVAPALAAVPPVDHQRAAQRLVLQVRVRSGWAPVRVVASAEAQVLCSLARGTALQAHAQQPGHRGRWFEVACDNHTSGWVHENHVRARGRLPPL